jgi:hypothetical protein
MSTSLLIEYIHKSKISHEYYSDTANIIANLKQIKTIDIKDYRHVEAK